MICPKCKKEQFTWWEKYLLRLKKCLECEVEENESN